MDSSTQTMIMNIHLQVVYVFLLKSPQSDVIFFSNNKSIPPN
jgi:hypothetical protein